MEQDQTQAKDSHRQERLNKYGGATLALVAVNTLQAIGVAGMINEENAEKYNSQSVTDKPPAQPEVAELEQPTDGTVVNPGQDKSVATEALDTPEMQVFPDLGIEWLPRTVKYWSPEIHAAAEEFDIPAQWVAILITQESGGYQYAASEAGARGLMQLIPSTERSVAHKLDLNDYDIFEPATNIRLGTKYMADIRNSLVEQLDNFGLPHPSEPMMVAYVSAGYHSGISPQKLVLNEFNLGPRGGAYFNRAHDWILHKNSSAKPESYRYWHHRFGYPNLVSHAEQELANRGVDWSQITWE